MDYNRNLDPELRETLAQVPSRDDLIVELIPRERAALEENVEVPLNGGVVHKDITINGPSSEGLWIRVHEPVSRGSQCGCLIWMHGGGYMLGTPLMDEGRIDKWVVDNGCVVVSPHYRLAPDHEYPAAIEDCYASLAWAIANSEELGLNSRGTVVGGFSAGGGLAAALALLARDRGEYQLTHQLLVYPMLDDRFEDYPSSRIQTPMWGSKPNRLGWQCYLGTAYRGSEVSPYAAAGRGKSLEDLPETFIGVGELDVLRDEAIAYASRLYAAGVSTELHVYPGATHGFNLLAPRAEVSKRLEREIEQFLFRSLGPRNEVHRDAPVVSEEGISPSAVTK